jgi:hypothetical protein
MEDQAAKEREARLGGLFGPPVSVPEAYSGGDEWREERSWWEEEILQQSLRHQPQYLNAAVDLDLRLPPSRDRVPADRGGTRSPDPSQSALTAEQAQLTPQQKLAQAKAASTMTRYCDDDGPWIPPRHDLNPHSVTDPQMRSLEELQQKFLTKKQVLDTEEGRQAQRRWESYRLELAEEQRRWESYRLEQAQALRQVQVLSQKQIKTREQAARLAQAQTAQTAAANAHAQALAYERARDMESRRPAAQDPTSMVLGPKQKELLRLNEERRTRDEEQLRRNQEERRRDEERWIFAEEKHPVRDARIPGIDHMKDLF